MRLALQGLVERVTLSDLVVVVDAEEGTRPELVLVRRSKGGQSGGARSIAAFLCSRGLRSGAKLPLANNGILIRKRKNKNNKKDNKPTQRNLQPPFATSPGLVHSWGILYFIEFQVLICLLFHPLDMLMSFYNTSSQISNQFVGTLFLLWFSSSLPPFSFSFLMFGSELFY